ncbi:tRNA (adenosine(37)-N6)-threonylcarbamoyltransferase complex dimerization subunit type 1 TsaB [Alkalilacustris brevis]|uniref:tRNA (adenosine(37)-N6)-threonylcarbamoyltransferase complex dimerization subunit type 1 TsaB n=1 Tax=Alkalilacustris brevis TaxID=2026338 RepID=UPI000E0D5564|nr:tRNA (adenosine(37)-N6)-threonylcarbamoyltransferase complex dimerization subunit type 1 TsaB [Alkalilacustris brevis]
MPDDPLILGFDTSAAHCAAALLFGGTILAEDHAEIATGQAERLMPMCEGLLAQAGIGWRDLAGLGVGVGPGNFTGIRIAVAAARGLALSLQRPAVGVSGFSALAEGAPGAVLTSIDARRGQCYLQVIGADGVAQGAPFIAAPDALPEHLPDRPGTRLRDSGLSVIGHEAEALARVTGGAATAPRFSLAVAIARQAAARLDTSQPRPAPLYLRPADAAPPSEAPPVLLP